MNKTKKKLLETHGWKVGTVAELLGMTSEDEALVEIRLALSQQVRKRRMKKMTQSELAVKLKSSQPRVAKVEAGDDSVSIDLLMRALLATGASPKEIGKTIAAVG